VGPEEGRRRVARTLAVVQGHPKLIMLAEGQAVDPEALVAHLGRAEQEWAGERGKLEAFFAHGESMLEADDFLKALTNWTRSLSAALPEAARTLFHFLCALEEGDRQSGIVEANWADLWQRLGYPGEAFDLGAALAALTAAGLIEFQPLEGDLVQFALHPGVAEAGRAEADGPFKAAADAELAAFWTTTFWRGIDEVERGGGRLVVQAALRGAPYLMRQGHWAEANTLLEQAVMAHDPSPGTVAAVLPLMRRNAEATKGTKWELPCLGALVSALSVAAPQPELESMMREVIRRAEALGDFRLASGGLGNLVTMLFHAGKFNELISLVEKEKEYIRLAGMGPWTQLQAEMRRLRALNALGRYNEVLSAVKELWQQQRLLPERSDQKESAAPWNIREHILNEGHTAAIGLQEWELSLALNAEMMAIKKAIGAPRREVARVRFNDYSGLLRLGRYQEVRQLLLDCRVIFEEENDIELLGKVFTALSTVEETGGHHQQAVSFEQTALRYKYLFGDPEGCAISHFNLANRLMVSGPPQVALAHRLAAIIIAFQTGSGRLQSRLDTLAFHLSHNMPDPPPLPASFDELCRTVEAVEGVRFRELFERLPKHAPTGEAALAEVLRLVQRESASATDA
jgi:tetratricopeptide (TPR) repeat protein